MAPETEPLDVLTIGEMAVDFISVQKTDTLSNASTFRRYLGGSPANNAVDVSKLGGTSAVIAKTGIGAFGKFLKSELRRHGVTTDYLLMDHRTHTTVIFISSTTATPDSKSSEAATTCSGPRRFQRRPSRMPGWSTLRPSRSRASLAARL